MKPTLKHLALVLWYGLGYCALLGLLVLLGDPDPRRMSLEVALGGAALAVLFRQVALLLRDLERRELRGHASRGAWRIGRARYSPREERTHG